MTKVFVSGATGFIAQHVVKQLLEQGYSVVGSVRSSEKGQKLIKAFGTPKFSYEVVAELQAEGSFDEALRKHPDVIAFLHTASPVTINAENIEEELLKPAVNGTINALKAIQVYGSQIKEVVITSSFAAVARSGNDDDVTYTEKSWNPITWEESLVNGRAGYSGSKKFAEKAAYDFARDNKVNFNINFINPTFVFGPQAFDSEVKETLNFSAEILNGFLKSDQIPNLEGGFIDVRDVAKAHIVVFEKSDIKNERLLLWNGKFTSQIILDILNENEPRLKGKIPIGKPGTGEERIKTLSKVDNSRTKALLSFDFIDLKQSVLDAVGQILDVKEAATTQ